MTHLVDLTPSDHLLAGLANVLLVSVDPATKEVCMRCIGNLPPEVSVQAVQAKLRDVLVPGDPDKCERGRPGSAVLVHPHGSPQDPLEFPSGAAAATFLGITQPCLSRALSRSAAEHRWVRVGADFEVRRKDEYKASREAEGEANLSE